MVAAEPDLGDVRKTLVLVDLLRGDVAMVVDDRRIGGVFMIEYFRRFGRQKKVFG